MSLILLGGAQASAVNASQTAAELNAKFAGAAGTFRAVPNMCKKVYMTVDQGHCQVSGKKQINIAGKNLPPLQPPLASLLTFAFEKESD